MKQVITTSIFVILIVGLLTTIITSNTSTKKSESSTIQEQENTDESLAHILYWGTTCPHCHDAIDWIEENAIEEKIALIRKEIYENKANALDLTQKAQSCGIDANSIGVPFMYTPDGKCLVGTPNITGYLDVQVSQQQSAEASNSAEKIQGSTE